jgi:hypothetical protein
MEEITPSDAYGDSILDGVYRGGNVYIQFDSKVFAAGSVTPFWPWGALGVMMTYGTGSPAPIGRLASAVAAAAILTATPGSAFNTAGGLVITTLTVPKAILAPNSSAQLLFHSRLREVPVRLLCLPTESSSGGLTTTSWFTVA